MSHFVEVEKNKSHAAPGNIHKPVLPETKVGEEGSAKRNILRRRNPTGSGRKGKTANNAIDDGSTDPASAALDENDPNYDSEVTW